MSAEHLWRLCVPALPSPSGDADRPPPASSDKRSSGQSTEVACDPGEWLPLTCGRETVPFRNQNQTGTVVKLCAGE